MYVYSCTHYTVHSYTRTKVVYDTFEGTKVVYDTSGSTSGSTEVLSYENR